MLLRTLNEHWLWQRRLQVFGHVFRAPSLDRLASLWLHKLGILGKDECRILRHVIQKGMIVVDVGANQGIYTLLMAALANPGKVFAFEPEPLLYAQLVANVRENRATNVTCSSLAISSSRRTLTLRSGGLNLGDNRIITNEGRDSGVSVTASTLDDLFPEERIDFLKMDIQGWEAEAIAGATKTLTQNHDLILMLEFWPFGLVRAGAAPDDLLNLLRQFGFSLWQVKDGTLSQLNPRLLPDPAKELSYCNILAVRNLSLVKELLPRDAL
jgi:FkbM family methyltransferase